MWLTYGVALLCVVGLSIGQLLFKYGATVWVSSGSWYATRALTPVLAAMLLYGFTSLAWVWVLRNVELGRVYPLMALAFVLVPLGSHVIFAEKFNVGYFIGVMMIVSGIVIATKFSP